MSPICQLRTLAPRMAVVLCLTLLLAGCKKSPDLTSEPTPSGTSGSPESALVPGKTGAQLALGSWQVERFSAASPSTSSSVGKLNEEAEKGAAGQVRVVFTATQIRFFAPGQPALSSAYTIREDGPRKVLLKNGTDDVVLTFQDADHMSIDRKGNAIGAVLYLRRVTETAANPSGSATSSSAVPTTSVSGSSSAGASGIPSVSNSRPSPPAK